MNHGLHGCDAGIGGERHGSGGNAAVIRNSILRLAAGSEEKCHLVPSGGEFHVEGPAGSLTGRENAVQRTDVLDDRGIVVEKIAAIPGEREADIIAMLCGQRTFRAQKRPVLGLEDIEIGEIVCAGVRAEHIGSGLLSHSDGHIGHARQRFCVGADGILHDTGDLRRNSKCDFSAAVVGIVLRDRIGDGRS